MENNENCPYFLKNFIEIQIFTKYILPQKPRKVNTRFGDIFSNRNVFTNSRLSGRLRLPMDNGKCIMDNDCVAKGDYFKLFPKEIPQLSIRASAR